MTHQQRQPSQNIVPLGTIDEPKAEKRENDDGCESKSRFCTTLCSDRLLLLLGSLLDEKGSPRATRINRPASDACAETIA
jgi:hypothetical protein